MHRFAKQFVEYCENTLDLSSQSDYGYRSLSVCILDCIYSLRARYYDVTVPLVERYAALYMDGDRRACGDTVSMLLQRIDAAGGPEEFARTVLHNQQKIGGKRKIPKEAVCYQLVQYLRDLHIETIEDFQNFESQEILEIVIRAVNGLGDAGTNYLFMLAGDPNRCKPDVHIHHCIRNGCGSNVGNEECQELFTDAVELLRPKYPNLTVRGLDGIIWRKYQSRAQRRKPYDPERNDLPSKVLSELYRQTGGC